MTKNDIYASKDVFAEPGYRETFKPRLQMMLDHINLLRLPGARVLDLACGPGWWGQALLPHGARVEFLDGRWDNLERVRSDVPGARVHIVNLERDALPDQRYDLVLAMGILYHVAGPTKLLRKIAAVTDRVFADTTVIDHDGELILHLREAADVAQFSLTGDACRFSPGWLVHAFKIAGFEHVHDISSAVGNYDPRPGFPGLVYDWRFERTCGWRRDERTLRRMYVASRNDPDDLLR